MIGSGPAGVAAALTGRALGARVTLVERATFGGARAAAAAPLEALRAAAAQAAQGNFAANTLNWDDVRLEAKRLADHAASDLSASRLTGAGVRAIEAQARFASPGELWAGSARIAARRFVVCVGRTARRPTGAGLDLVRDLTPQEILDLPIKPRHVVILGGDARALEIAQSLARLGIAATAICETRALAEFPLEAAAVALRRIRAEGARALESETVVTAEPVGAERGARLTLASGEVLDASHVVFCGGWRSATDGLGLEAAGVRVSPEGLVVDAQLRTTNQRIFAAGEAVAGAQPHRGAAERMGRLAARRALLPMPVDAALTLEPRVARTDPEIVAIGATQAAPGSGLRALRSSLGADERARACGRTEGHATLIVDAQGRLAGACLVGPQASEAAGLLSLALAQRLDTAALAAMPCASSSLAEALARAALTDGARRARAPAVARLLKLGRWLR